MTATTRVPDIYRRPAELLQQLIRFDTSQPAGNEQACIAYIAGLILGCSTTHTQTASTAARARSP